MRSSLKWPSLTLTAVGLAHLPLLSAHIYLLSQRPQYEFYPLVPLGAAVLLWSRGRRLGLLEPGEAGRANRLYLAAWTVLALAGVLVWPWLGAIAGLCAFAAVAYDRGGGRLLRAIMPAWIFLWLDVGPPLALDRLQIATLQGATARLASLLLDRLGLYHVVEGFVIKVEGRRLLVAEACSGFNSLLVVGGFSLFLILWT